MQCMLIDLPVGLRSSPQNIFSHNGDEIRSIDSKNNIPHGFHSLRDTERSQGYSPFLALPQQEDPSRIRQLRKRDAINVVYETHIR